MSEVIVIAGCFTVFFHTMPGALPLQASIPTIPSLDGTITPVPSMLTQRYGHSAVLLRDGNVLVAGGHTSGGGVVNTAELFDPAANTWRWASNTMTDARADFTLSQLLDGNVLVAGGDNGSGPISGVETFDLLTKTFKYAGYLNKARKAHAASVLKDGRVLITGGSGFRPRAAPSHQSAWSSNERIAPR
jgi:hypothetical protein